ncbi:uncharacterized protein VP01_3678g1, partial [Puccinia sorghi]
SYTNGYLMCQSSDNEELVLNANEDILLKTALLATIDDNIKVGVAECASGLDAADLDTHFRKVENMVKTLFRSGFNLSEESFIGLFFHLSLPNVETFPFVNVARQLDLRMEHGNMVVKNTDLLRLAKNELTLFCNNWRAPPERRTDRQAGLREFSVLASAQGVLTASKWCHKCKNNAHFNRDCTKPLAGQFSSGSNNPFRGTTNSSFNSNHSNTAPPRPNFQVHSVELVDRQEQHPVNPPTFQSITLDDINPEVSQEEIDTLLKNGGRLFGLDSCASHTFTNDLSILFDTFQLVSPIPLQVATNSTKSYVTVVGKLKIKNFTGSITIKNVYYSPDASCTLLSAVSLSLGGGNVQVNSEGNASVHFDNGFSIQSLCIHRRWQIPALVLPGYPPAVFVPPAKPINPLKSIEGCDKSFTILSASVKQSDALMWHRRLGHPMDIIVSDVLGPFVEGFSGVQYLVVFRNLASTYLEGFLLKEKKDFCLTFKRYIEQMERLTGKKLKRFYNGPESVNVPQHNAIKDISEFRCCGCGKESINAKELCQSGSSSRWKKVDGGCGHRTVQHLGYFCLAF